MNSCECLSNELNLFLVKRLENPSVKPSEVLKKHISECESCRKLVENPKMAKMFLNLNKSIEVIREKTVLPQKPTSVRPWQLWRFSYDNGEKYAIGVVNSLINNKNNDTEYIQIIPAYLNYSENETTEKDIKLLSSDTSLYLPILVEAWNNALIDSKQLDTFYGNVGINYRSLISNYLGEKAENLSDEVNSFRQYETNMGNYYSFEAYNKMSNSTRLPKKYDSSYRNSCNELMELAAATDDDSKKLEDFYYNIVVPAIDNNNEFSAELMSDYVSIISEKSFDYSITLEDEYGAKIVFNSKNAVIKIYSKDLNDFNSVFIGFSRKD